MVYLKLVLMALIWGGTFVAGKMIALEVPEFSAAFIRFLIASIFLGMLVWQTEPKFPVPTPKQLLALLLLGASGIFAYNVFFFKALQLVEASRAAVIIATNPIFITLASLFLFKERTNPRKIIGILLSLFGACYAITRGDLLNIFGDAWGQGELFVFFTVFSWVTYSIIGKVVMAGLTPLVSVCYSTWAGTLLLLFPALNQGVVGHIVEATALQWGALFYLGFLGTVVGFLWYYQGILRLGAVRAGLFINLVPISAIFLSVLILDEPIELSLFIGTGLVISGVLIVNYPGTSLRIPKQ